MKTLNFRVLLWPFSLLYGLVVIVRNRLFDLDIVSSTTFDLPVISVGNITAGGTGKTPHVEFLAARLKDKSRLAVLSRGYKRNTREFILLSDHTVSSDAGDEPVQIKAKFPEVQVAVDRNRIHGIQQLKKIKPRIEAVILDDAFQHRYVKPGISILLVDYNRPVFRDLLLPAGNLREPWRNVRRADIVLVTKCPEQMTNHMKSLFDSRLRRKPGQEVYYTSYAYGLPEPLFPVKKSKAASLDYKKLSKKHAGILLVSGIADPTPLRKFLDEYTFVEEELRFADHHAYDAEDIGTIGEKFRRIGKKNKHIFVTEKDAVKLREMEILDEEMRQALYVIPIEVQFLFAGEKPFLLHVSKVLKKSGKGLSL